MAQAAKTPSPVTLDAQITGASTVTLDGYVVPGGVAASWYFAYAPGSSAFCTSYGASGTAADTPTQTATSAGPVSADVSGLTPGLAYCYGLMVSQGGSPVSGGIKPFTVGLPSAWTQRAESTGEDTATVSGAVDAGGQATAYEVGYDTGDSEWCLSAGKSGTPSQTSASASLDPSLGGDQEVSIDLSGLAPGTEYCAALIAINGTGTTDGATMDFLEGAPDAEVSSLAMTTDTTETIDGEIDPAGQTTSYAVAYDTADSDWCTHEGLSGAPQLTTAGTIEAGQGTVADVEVDLTGLAPGTAYCAELLAINNAASASSVMTTFTITGTAGPTSTTTTTTTTSTTSTTAATPTTPTTPTTPATPTATRTSTPPSTSTSPARTSTSGSAASGQGSTTTATLTSPSTGRSGGRTSHAPVYAIAVGKARTVRAFKVQVPKAGTLRLRITSGRATRVTVTLTLPAVHHRHRGTVRVARVSIRAHATRTITVRFSKVLMRALRGRRKVRLTAVPR